MSGVRGRFRVQMQQEIKDAAVRQLAVGGPQALSINAIGKELGVSGPALYRYFAGRDELLTALILDAYRDFTAALSAALETAASTPPERLAAVAYAYRTWALAEPHRYRLLFVAPLPGYDAHDAALVEAGQQAMGVVMTVLSDFPPQTFLAVVLWSRLHGLVSLEIERNFASMALDADLLFAGEVAAIIRTASAGDPQ
jgi:AcrR family transcriptional regulator